MLLSTDSLQTCERHTTISLSDDTFLRPRSKPKNKSGKISSPPGDQNSTRATRAIAERNKRPVAHSTQMRENRSDMRTSLEKPTMNALLVRTSSVVSVSTEVYRLLKKESDVIKIISSCMPNMLTIILRLKFNAQADAADYLVELTLSCLT